MTKRSSKRLQRIHDGATNTGERRWTRLSKDSDQDVLDLATDDYTVANVIRDLVDEALHVRHLNKAGRHPAVRELLVTFDEMVDSTVRLATAPLHQRLAQLEEGQDQTNRFLSALFITLSEQYELKANTSDEQYDQLLFNACAGQANKMTRLILAPQTHAAPPPDASRSALRPIVARELSSEDSS